MEQSKFISFIICFCRITSWRMSPFNSNFFVLQILYNLLLFLIYFIKKHRLKVWKLRKEVFPNFCKILMAIIGIEIVNFVLFICHELTNFLWYIWAYLGLLQFHFQLRNSSEIMIMSDSRLFHFNKLIIYIVTKNN